jgi:tetratricopeptide (TPR) repeat protein
MALAVPDLVLITTLVQRGLLPRGGRILDVGAQEMFCAGQEQAIARFMEDLGVPTAGVDLTALSTGYAGALLEKVGFRYLSLDVYAAPSSVLFDLNNDELPASMENAFDLVMNHGTTEHVMDQRHCFDVIHRCTRVGGVMLHSLPFQGYFDHGFFAYTGRFFHTLARFNDYQAIEISFCEGQPRPVPGYVVGYPPEYRPGVFHSEQLADAGVVALLRKTRNDPFWLPLDVDVGKLSPADIADLKQKQAESPRQPQTRAAFLVRAGEAVLALGHDEAARACFEQALGQDPRCAAAWSALGKVALGSRPEQALAYYVRALDVAPRHHDSLVGALRAARLTGRAQETAVLTEVLGRFYPDDPELRA